MKEFVGFLAHPKSGSFKSAATLVCHRRIVVRDGSIKVVALFQQHSSSTTRVWVSESILRVCVSAFKWRNTFHLISFESNSRLMRIESDGFSQTSLESIMIPSSVEILGSSRPRSIRKPPLNRGWISADQSKQFRLQV
jgi:hypothetical protein